MEVGKSHLEDLVLFVLLRNICEPELQGCAVTALNVTVDVHSRLPRVHTLWAFGADKRLIARGVLIW
jgi:hypothetical protein